MSLLNTVAGAQLDFTAYGGNTFAAALTFTDGNNNPINMAAFTLKMEVRKKGATVALVTLVSGDGITVSGTGNNIINLDKNIDAPGGSYLYDLKATASDGSVITYLYGKFNVIQNVTDAILS